MPDMQHRAVAAVREWNARLGRDATYLVCSHGDVIKAIVADSLGLHLDQCQRIQADPCSLTVIRYTPMRPFLVRMNDRGGGVDDLMPRANGHGHAQDRAKADSDAAVGGGTGGADPDDRAESAHARADMVNGATGIQADGIASGDQQSVDTRG
jgi:probable phosphoglycerate mutase